MAASKLYGRLVEAQVEKEAAIWERRIGAPALRLCCESRVRFRSGWLVAVVGSAVFVPTILSGAPAAVTVPLVIMVLISSVSIMLSAMQPTKGYVTATMQYLGLPEKPGITAQALQSPADFDLWLLETRGYPPSDGR